MQPKPTPADKASGARGRWPGLWPSQRPSGAPGACAAWLLGCTGPAIDPLRGAWPACSSLQSASQASWGLPIQGYADTPWKSSPAPSLRPQASLGQGFQCFNSPGISVLSSSAEGREQLKKLKDEAAVPCEVWRGGGALASPSVHFLPNDFLWVVDSSDNGRTDGHSSTQKAGVG